jgi:CRISPR-associated protein Cmr3
MNRSFVLEPVDVLFFRDARPFSAGQEFNARGVFPPPPSAVCGAIRTAAMLQHGVRFREDGSLAQVPPEVREVWGAPGGPIGRAHIRGPFLIADGEPLYPLPADLQPPDPRKERRGVRLLPVGPHQPPVAACSLPENLSLLWAVALPQDGLAERARWLTRSEIEAYLAGEPRAAQRKLPWDEEPRFGIALDFGSRAVRMHHLYAYSAIRFRPPAGDYPFGVGVVVDNDANAPLGPGAIRLGGEGRAVRIRELRDFDPWPKPPPEHTLRERFLLYLATPLPGRMTPCAPGEELRIGEVRARLVAACVPSAFWTSGFDIAQRKHKPLRWGAPAGSVFFFQHLEGDPSKLHAASLCKDSEAREGYGLVFVGGWSHAQPSAR